MLSRKILLGLLAVLLADLATAIQNGYTVRSPYEHPYFVHIITTPEIGYVRQHGGTLISDRWVLTSLSAVKGAKTVAMYFGVNELDKIGLGFQMTVGYDNVVPYPTMVDDIALILLPDRLKFSSTIQPIKLMDYPAKEGAMGVVFGFQNNQNTLRYGFFRVQSLETCKKSYTNFDGYRQVCTLAWTNPNQRPCKGNEGTGLIYGWPEAPRLVGVFSDSISCVNSAPAVYVSLENYMFWLNSVISHTPPVPPSTESSFNYN